MRNRLIAIIAFVMLAVPAFGAFSAMKPRPVGEILSDIRQEQGLKDDGIIKPQTVSPARLEELGDAVMEAMVGDRERHERMDAMMGGEGSASLSALHQRIGLNYLSGGPTGMMNGGMMGIPNNNAGYAQGGRNMMGGYGWGFGGMFMGLLFMAVLVAILFFVVKAAGGGGSGGHSMESPLDILKKRYARGEISKEEFERIKKDLES